VTIETPCIKVCVIDTVTGHCIGCGRSTAEVGGWLAMNPEQRRFVMSGLPERLKRMTSPESRGRRRVAP
jgi:uncharacterized protein